MPSGYYKAQKEKIDAQNEKNALLKERNARILRRQGICELCDSAIVTGRTILKNEEKSESLQSKHGLVTLVKMTCSAIVENYKEEVPWMDCGHLSQQMWNHYDKKYVGDVKVPPKCDGGCPEQKKVNFALVASLQNCQTMVGVTFCDGEEKDEKGTVQDAAAAVAVSQPHDGTLLEKIQVQLPPPRPPLSIATATATATSHKSTWSEFGIPPSPQPPLPTPTHALLQPGPVIQSLPSSSSSCDCDCCQQELDPCSECPTTTLPAPISQAPPAPPPPSPVPPLAPCQDDPCDSGVDADLIFHMTGVDAGKLTDEAKKSMVHLFSAVLVVDDSQITLTDLGDAHFQPLSADPLPTPPALTLPLPPSQPSDSMEQQVVQQEQQSTVIEPIIVQQERPRRRLLMLDNLDLEKTVPAKSSIPVPIVATLPPSPPTSTPTPTPTPTPSGLTIRLVVSCSSVGAREEIIARYVDVCHDTNKMLQALRLVLPGAQSATCPQVEADTQKGPTEEVEEEDEAIRDDDSDPSTIGTTMSESDTMTDDIETPKNTSLQNKNATEASRESIGPVLTGSESEKVQKRKNTVVKDVPVATPMNEHKEKDENGSGATGIDDGTGSGEETGSATGQEEEKDAEEEQDEEEDQDEEEEQEAKDVEKEEKKIKQEEIELKKEEKEELTELEKEKKKNDDESDVKFRAKVPTTLLRGTNVQDAYYTLLKADEKGQVSLDAVVHDLEHQGYSSSTVQ